MVFDTVMGLELDLDISVACPWCPDIISKAAKEDGAAALKRERKKRNMGKNFCQEVPIPTSSNWFWNILAIGVQKLMYI